MPRDRTIKAPIGSKPGRYTHLEPSSSQFSYPKRWKTSERNNSDDLISSSVYTIISRTSFVTPPTSGDSLLRITSKIIKKKKN